MAGILLGDEECTYKEIVDLFDKESIEHLKLKWRSMAFALEISEIDKQNIQDKNQSYEESISDVLKAWRTKNKKLSTLGTFLLKLPRDWNQLKEYVRDIIRDKARTWNDLDADSQHVVLKTRVKFLGRNYSLSSIQDKINKDKFEDIMNKSEMSDFLIKSFNNEEWEFGHYEIPNRLKYYIERKIMLKTKLDPEIFKKDCSDIFLIEGIERPQLTNLADGKATGVSSKQLKKVTTRFILLQHKDDYIDIKKATKDPVHRIMRKNDDQYFWMSTSGSPQIIRMFLTNDAEKIDERVFVKQHLSEFNNRPLAICSSPGMGKSVLLANMAREVIKNYPERIVLYFNLSFFIQKLSLVEPKVDSKNIKQLLASISPISSIGKEFLLEFLLNYNIYVEIFLDGFDEISLEYLQLTKQFLKCLMECPNMRTCITSRPHMLNKLENTLEIISLDIAPFNRKNQINFLCGFWTSAHNNTQPKGLSKFALNVLKSREFKNQSAPSQIELGGIPLQCFMLAQVYENQAIRYSKKIHDIPILDSLYELYGKFMRFKFEKLDQCERHWIKVYHWKEALILLFPDNQEIIHELTKNDVHEAVPWKQIYTVGILEQVQGKPCFLHRTFAEYLLAKFIVEEILINEIVDTNISIKFIIECVLHIYKTARGHNISMDDVEVICKFIKSSKFWKSGELNNAKLKPLLLSQCDLSVESIQDDLDDILSKWCYHMGPNATIDIIDKSLKDLNCGQLVDELHERLVQGYAPVLQHEMLCTFVDVGIAKYETMLAEKNFRVSKFDVFASSAHNLDQLKWKLLLCTQHGYQFLTQILVNLYRDTSVFTKLLSIDDKMSEELILRALRTDNVNFLKYIHETVKSFMEFNFIEFCKMWTSDNVIIKRSAFVESITRGNYELVEYLIALFRDDVKYINNIWIACFFDNWKDSSNQITKKDDILRLLIPGSDSNLVKTLEMTLPGGVNLVLLKTLFELCNYVPCESDVKFISSSVQFHCRDAAELDCLVNWLISKNLAQLLTYKYRSHFCLLNFALLKNTLTPETLELVHKKSCFDLGIIFQTAVQCKNEAMVKKIVELAADVNLVDSSKNTLLHWASYIRKWNTVNYLLSMDAKVNLINDYGSTSLHYVFMYTESSESSHLIHDIVDLLVTNNADVNTKNKAGLRAIDIAYAHQDRIGIENKTINLLENEMSCNNGRELRSDECVASSTDEFETIKYGACFNACFGGCFFPLIWNIVKTTKNVNKSNSINATLLHEAALYGEIKTMEYLLLNGADANIKDNYGDTALHYIFHEVIKKGTKFVILFPSNIQQMHPCVELLLKYNANVAIKNKNGKTALDYALVLKESMNIEDHTIQLLNEKFQEQCFSTSTNIVSSI